MHWRDGGGRLRSRYLGKYLPAHLTGTGALGATDVPGLAGRTSAATAEQAAVETANPALRVRTLGGFEVWRGVTALSPRLRRQRNEAALLKHLLGAPGYQLSREQVQDLLWPDADVAKGAGHLRTTLHRLRRLLRDPLSGETYIHAEGDLLMLRPSGKAEPASGWLDAATFEDAAGTALRAEDASACRAALACYLGDYLPSDAEDHWALARREALRVHYLAVLLHLADLAGAHGEAEEAEQRLRTVLRVDPCHEEAAARLMGVLAAADRAVEALRVYRELAAALRRDLDAAPSADVEAVRAACIARLEAPLATAISVHPAAPSRPTNLPQALTSFVGRTDEQDEIRRLLVEFRLLTLAGPGGCGKTRLAVQVGEGLVDAYQDGVWLVQLGALPAGEHDRALVPRAVARALGVQEQLGEALATTLTAFLAPRRLLLVLDNCEHLLVSCAALTLDAAGSLPPAPGPDHQSRAARRTRRDALRRALARRSTCRCAAERSARVRGCCPLPVSRQGQERRPGGGINRPRHRRHLPASRGAAPGHRAGGGAHERAARRGLSRSSGRQFSCAWCRPAHRLAAAAHAVGHARLEHGAARRTGAPDAAPACRVRRRLESGGCGGGVPRQRFPAVGVDEHLCYRRRGARPARRIGEQVPGPPRGHEQRSALSPPRADPPVCGRGAGSCRRACRAQ